MSDFENAINSAAAQLNFGDIILIEEMGRANLDSVIDDFSETDGRFTLLLPPDCTYAMPRFSRLLRSFGLIRFARTIASTALSIWTSLRFPR